eukprot:762723-Hanusia_phi.AAC.2
MSLSYPTAHEVHTIPPVRYHPPLNHITISPGDPLPHLPRLIHPSFIQDVRYPTQSSSTLYPPVASYLIPPWKSFLPPRPFSIEYPTSHLYPRFDLFELGWHGLPQSTPILH